MFQIFQNVIVIKKIICHVVELCCFTDYLHIETYKLEEFTSLMKRKCLTNHSLKISHTFIWTLCILVLNITVINSLLLSNRSKLNFG